MRTAICDQLNIDVPIIQAAMGGASCPALAAAVSNAGGLGMLALSWTPVDAIRNIVHETRALTHRPFGVNLALDQPQEERLSICLREGVPVISFFWHDTASLVEKAHAGGAKVLHTVGSADEARRAVARGVDVIVAQGWEAGGHVWGQVASLPLVPAVVDAAGSTPVVAAGGIADGRGLAAVLALGAAGAWIGTRFLASPEAAIHARYRELLLQAKETDTCYGVLFDRGWPDAPHRTLRNKTVKAWEAAGRPQSGQRPGEGDVIAKSAAQGDILRYQSAAPSADAAGDIEAMSLWAGQSVGLVSKLQPAAEIVKEIHSEASAILKRLGAMSG